MVVAAGVLAILGSTTLIVGWQANNALHDRAIADQGQGLHDRLQAWKGNAYEQRDDICVMGFEMPANNT